MENFSSVVSQFVALMSDQTSKLESQMEELEIKIEETERRLTNFEIKLGEAMVYTRALEIVAARLADYCEEAGISAIEKLQAEFEASVDSEEE